MSSRDSMAAKYTVRQAVELLFDDEFGLSDGNISEEEGEEVYSYRGGESLSKEAVEDLGREVDTVTGGDSFSASSQEESEDDSEVEQLDAPPRGKFRIYSIY